MVLRSVNCDLDPSIEAVVGVAGNAPYIDRLEKLDGLDNLLAGSNLLSVLCELGESGARSLPPVFSMILSDSGTLVLHCCA